MESVSILNRQKPTTQVLNSFLYSFLLIIVGGRRGIYETT